ncbi:MAG: L-gulonate 3-dehydrogenase [Halieaceae bacterium]|jgi:L-gulonate 3-dehydrogenase
MAKRIACIGVGTVGRAWSIVFARAGFDVALYDAKDGAADAAMLLVQRNLDDLEAAGLIDSASQVFARINNTRSLEAAVEGTSHVQESVREDVEIKQRVFAELCAAAPKTATFGSSTSAIPGSAFLEHVSARERCIVAHPVNPPSLIPLVELCPAPWTSAHTVDTVRALMIEVGQRPILLKKEIPGFLLNRLQYTLVGEALHLVGEGYCDAEDIDAVLTHGLALRWILMGPLQVAHLNASEGFQGFVDQLGDMMRTVGRDARPDYPWDDDLIADIHGQLSERIPVADIAERQVERDRRIMSLLRWREQQLDGDTKA